MAFVNNTMIIRRDLMSKLIKLYKDEELLSEIDRIPLKMSPKNAQARGRCCIHKERAVLKYKILPILGFSINEEEDELTSLSVYAQQALERKKLNKNTDCCRRGLHKLRKNQLCSNQSLQRLCGTFVLYELPEGCSQLYGKWSGTH